MYRFHCAIFLCFLFSSFLQSCKKDEDVVASSNKKVLYDGCPECEGAEYVTSTKKWTVSNISFAFKGFSTSQQDNTRKKTIEDALRVWEKFCNLNFTQISDSNKADIVFSFEKGEHGDGLAFDGRIDGDGDLLAHGFFPPPTRDNLAGDVHFDAEDDWTTDIRTDNKQPIDLFTVALHEIGHSLGIRHSEKESAIMYPEYKGSKRELTQDDIDAIQSLYGARTIQNSTTVPVIFSNNTLSGISKAVVFNNQIYCVVAYEPVKNGVSGYPDERTWYKTKLISESNANALSLETSSISPSPTDYDLKTTPNNQLSIVYQVPTGTQYGFRMPYKVWNGSTLTSNELIFSNANWGVNAQIQFTTDGIPKVCTFAFAGYALLYHTKTNGVWGSTHLTPYSNIVLNLKSVTKNNTYYLTARHNVSNQNNQEQTLKIYSNPLTSNQWTETSTQKPIDNNCDLKVSNTGDLSVLYTYKSSLILGQGDKYETVIDQQGIDHRASLIFDNDNNAFVGYQTANKVVVLKKQGTSWVQVFTHNINTTSTNLGLTQGLTLLNKSGSIYAVYSDDKNVYAPKIK
jgi:predicted Zn-dependent protease